MDKVKIALRCDAGQIPEIGTGHIIRCIKLAEQLDRNGGAEISFIMKSNEYTQNFAKTSKWAVHLFEGNELGGCHRIFEQLKPDVIVVDHLDSDPDFMEMAKKQCKVLITIDDCGKGAGIADIRINGILESRIADYSGPAYIITPNLTERGQKKQKLRKTCRKIFVSMGGYDHLNLTQKVADALDKLDSIDPETEIAMVVGSAYGFMDKLVGFAKKSKKRFKVFQTPKNFPAMLSESDLAITNGGLTMFESMGFGIPTMVLAQYEHQAETAKKYDNLGAVQFIGNGNSVDTSRVSEMVTTLIRNYEKRSELSDIAAGLVDGKGAERVADIVRIIRTEEYDSRFFGKKIARMLVEKANKRILGFANEWCKKNKINCTYYLCEADNAEGRRLAVENGYREVDERVTLETTNLQIKETGHGNIRECKESDLERIKEIAKSSYTKSRYYSDGAFKKDDLERFYAKWLENTFRSQNGKVFIWIEEGEPVGYIAGKCEDDGRTGSIVLVGVKKEYGGKGIGSELVRAFLHWAQEKGMRKAIVVTQGRNIAAKKLYEKSGFKIVSIKIWYHKWF